MKSCKPDSKQECAGHLAAVGDALYAIGGKWKLRIIIALQEGSKRFNELQRTVEGISARVLSTELKELELNGFVKRKVYHSQTPVVVEYEITPYSESLHEVVSALSDWGKRHRDKIRREMKRDKMTVDG
ncbi:MAG TPA: helix-turn-helix domain-containing protein [Puia sp.]|nr:helix-turn-helix domain-containing protein [Puia sp.]